MDIIALNVPVDGFDDPSGNPVRYKEGALAFAYRSQYSSLGQRNSTTDVTMTRSWTR